MKSVGWFRCGCSMKSVVRRCKSYRSPSLQWRPCSLCTISCKANNCSQRRGCPILINLCLEVYPLRPIRQEKLFEEKVTAELPQDIQQRCRELLSLMFLAVIGANPTNLEEEGNERED